MFRGGWSTQSKVSSFYFLQKRTVSLVPTDVPTHVVRYEGYGNISGRKGEGDTKSMKEVLTLLPRFELTSETSDSSGVYDESLLSSVSDLITELK